MGGRRDGAPGQAGPPPPAAPRPGLDSPEDETPASGAHASCGATRASALHRCPPPEQPIRAAGGRAGHAGRGSRGRGGAPPFRGRGGSAVLVGQEEKGPGLGGRGGSQRPREPAPPPRRAQLRPRQRAPRPVSRLKMPSPSSWDSDRAPRWTTRPGGGWRRGWGGVWKAVEKGDPDAAGRKEVGNGGRGSQGDPSPPPRADSTRSGWRSWRRAGDPWRVPSPAWMSQNSPDEQKAAVGVLASGSETAPRKVPDYC